MTVKEKKEKQEEKSEVTNHSMNMAIIGGVVGAGIGLLSSPGTSKKVFKSLSESEVMKVASNQLRKTAQEIIAEQAQNSIKQFANGYMGKGGGLLSPKKKKDDEDEKDDSRKEDFSSKFEEVKEDNKNLNERLDKIESLLNNLVDSKK